MEEASNQKSAVPPASKHPTILHSMMHKIEKEMTASITKFPSKPPKIKALALFAIPTRDKEPLTVALPASSSAQDLRSLEAAPDKEVVETVEHVATTATSSPTGYLDDSSRGSDSETSSSKASTSSTTSEMQQAMQNHNSMWKGFFRIWKQKNMRRLSSFPPLGVPKIGKWKSCGRDGHDQSAMEEAQEFCFFKPTWKTFTTTELRNATNNFSDENLIGKGGFAEVYEGCLEDGQFVAVKRLNKGSVEERTNNFLAELGIMVHINHPNIAKLIGVGVEDDLHLVLRLSPHGSLSSLLHGPKAGSLAWSVRYKIAVGTAEGLAYLHETCQRRIIHRDIKTANILLTEDFEPQICDFGLAKWLPDQLSHHTVSSFEGTFGYLAPEYLTHGVVDEKTDVFAFGVLLLELLSGRKALDSSQQSLVMWAKPLIDKGKYREVIDPGLTSYDKAELRQVLSAAALSIQTSSMLRPRISEVLCVLRGEELSPEMGELLPTLSGRRRTYSEELYDVEEYNATRSLSDLHRHKEIALDFNGSGDLDFSD